MRYKPVVNQTAYLLHSRPYRETSLLLEVFTPDHGRVGLVARGARRPKSRIAGTLQPFNPLLVSWRGRGDLATLVSAETNGRPVILPGKRIISGLYLNELMMRLLHRHDPHTDLFSLYDGILRRLADTRSEQRELRLFEKRLLDELGYGLVLDHEVEQGEAIDPAMVYEYILEKGPVPLIWDDGNAVITIRGSSLLSLANEMLDDEQSLKEIKQLLRTALSLYLGSKPLNSRRLYREHMKIQSRSGPEALKGEY